MRQHHIQFVLPPVPVTISFDFHLFKFWFYFWAKGRGFVLIVSFLQYPRIRYPY